MNLVLCYDVLDAGSATGVATYGIDTAVDVDTAMASMRRAVDLRKPKKGILLTAREGNELGRPVLLGRVIKLRPLTVVVVGEAPQDRAVAGDQLTAIGTKRPDRDGSAFTVVTNWASAREPAEVQYMARAVTRLADEHQAARLFRGLLSLMDSVLADDLIGRGLALKDMTTAVRSASVIHDYIDRGVLASKSDRSVLIQELSDLGRSSGYADTRHLSADVAARLRHATSAALWFYRKSLQQLEGMPAVWILDSLAKGAAEVSAGVGHPTLASDMIRREFTWSEVVLSVIVGEWRNKLWLQSH